MLHDTNVYTPSGQPVGRDWSGEISMPRAASDTGIGGIAAQPEPLPARPIGRVAGPAAGAEAAGAMMSGAPLPVFS